MFYIQYDDHGNLLSVTNEVRKDSACVTIDETTFIEFVSGKENLHDFIILGLPLNDPVPTLIRRDQQDNFNVDKSIHEIERTAIGITAYTSSAFYIIQDKKKMKWQGRAQLSDANKITLLNTAYMNKTKSIYKSIYVTEKNNPNILIGELSVDMHKFKNNKLFDIQIDNASLVLSDDISLYCPVHYEKFYHVIKE